MKVEVQSTELVNIIKSSNSSEILLWILSAILHNKFQGAFFYLHILHILRGILGFFILFKMPRSNELVEAMESVQYKKDLERKIFNDYTRNIINIETFTKAKSLQYYMLVYMIMTLLNVFIDLIDLISGLSKFDDEGHTNADKINICVNFFIVFIYLGKFFILIFLYFNLAIDFTYVFWFSALNYIFPKKYLDPITDGFYGMFEKTKTFFKFGKKETDLKSEDLMTKNQENKPIMNSNSNKNEQVDLNVENRNQNENAFDNANPYPRIDNSRNNADAENLDQ